MVTRSLKKYNQRGQALLMVIVALTVALAVVSSVSLRNLSSVSRVAETDTFSRVSAAAEGGIERFLQLSPSALRQIQSGISGATCGLAGADITTVTGANSPTGQPACRMTFPQGSASDPIAEAYITVSRYPAAGADTLVNIKKDEIYEFNLRGASVSTFTACWNPVNASDSTHLYMLAYSDSNLPNLVKGGFCPISGCGANFSGFVTSVVSPSCTGASTASFNISSGGPYSAVRIRAIGGDVNIRVPNSVVNVQQGYQIDATGVLQNNTSAAARVTKSVFKSDLFLPVMFDFGLYTGGSLP